MFPIALHSLRDGLLALVYPQTCRLCDGFVESWYDGVVCARCWQDPLITRLFVNQECCGKCGALLPAVRTFETAARPCSQVEARSCGRCVELPFTCARACGAYSGSLAANVLFLKSYPHICRRLRGLIEQALEAYGETLASDLLIPIPLHPRRKAERGFNQAEVIAAVLASYFKQRLTTEVLRRAKYTERHRAGLDAIDRARSVERAFVVCGERALRGRTVLLVDDLLTTGSTLTAAARTLQQAGAGEVRVFTLARVKNRSWQG